MGDAMAYTKSLAVRNAILSDIRTRAASGFIKIYTGSRPADPDTAATGTLLGTINLGATAFSSPTTGSMTLSGVPLEDSSADASGTAGYFRILASDGTTGVVDGTITATGGGGEAEIVSTTVTAGQPLRVTSLTVTQAA